jgi:ABC-2 type transport system ATP-binding protein
VPLSPKQSNVPRPPRPFRIKDRDSGPRPSSAVRPPADPGPPPPLPADLVAPPVRAYPDDIVIPPRPPLPGRPQPASDVRPAEIEPGIQPEPEIEADAEPEIEADEVEPEIEADEVEPEIEADEVEPEPEPEPEPHVELNEPFIALQLDDEGPEPGAEPAPAALAAQSATIAPFAPSDPQSAPEAVPEPAAALDSLIAEAVDAHENVDPFAASVVLDESVSTVPAALFLRGVSKRFGDTRAVDGIDLTVPAGTFYGLVGPNGAGKTTTLSLISGLLRPDNGTIRVGGVDARSHPTRAKRLMGVLPDRLRTFDRLTGRQLLYYYGVLRGLPSATVESRIADLARAFDLTDALGRTMSDYSAGMVKKVMLAGALIHSPRLLVLDEPFESVDPVSSAVILDILSAYVAHGGTVILSSHGMELVERVCTRVAVMVAGQVLAEGTVDEVRGELTLEQRFVELAGGLSDVEGLEWLHTFSD